MCKTKFQITNLKELELFALKLAKNIKSRDAITLRGDLGVGKTTLVQYLIRLITSSEVEVTSPTFNLLQLYEFNNCEIWHFDLYRLKNKLEVYELGIEDAFDRAITIIEWPEIIENLLPSNRLDIKIDYLPNTQAREISLTAFGDWQKRMM